jgi:hypothetical protein
MKKSALNLPLLISAAVTQTVSKMITVMAKQGDETAGEKRRRGEILLHQQQVRRRDDQRVAQQQKGVQAGAGVHAVRPQQEPDRGSADARALAARCPRRPKKWHLQCEATREWRFYDAGDLSGAGAPRRGGTGDRVPARGLARDLACRRRGAAPSSAPRRAAPRITR